MGMFERRLGLYWGLGKYLRFALGYNKGNLVGLPGSFQQLGIEGVQVTRDLQTQLPIYLIFGYGGLIK